MLLQEILKDIAEKTIDRNTIYYDLYKILSKKDLDNEYPTFYIIESNRSDGKTTSVLNLMYDYFKETGKQCGIIFRHQYELNSAPLLFENTLEIREDNNIIQAFPHAKGLFYELRYLTLDENKKVTNAETFGFSFDLSKPDEIKKYSPSFANVDVFLFDEFQTESGKYLPKEIEKFQSFWVSVARGHGKQARPITCFMCSNKVTLMNPYYIYWGIHKRVKIDTKFLRGSGWVCNFNYNPNSSKAITESGVGKAFANSKYLEMATDNIYLVESLTFIEQPKTQGRYLATVIYNSKKYGIRVCTSEGIIFLSQKFNPSCKTLLAFKPSDHTQNTMLLDRYSYIFKQLRDAYFQGALRFDNIETKNSFFDILAVDIFR